eukprot:312941_1
MRKMVERHPSILFTIRNDNYSTKLQEKSYDDILGSIISYLFSIKCNQAGCSIMEKFKIGCLCDVNQFQLYTYKLLMAIIEMKHNTNNDNQKLLPRMQTICLETNMEIKNTLSLAHQVVRKSSNKIPTIDLLKTLIHGTSDVRNTAKEICKLLPLPLQPPTSQQIWVCPLTNCNKSSVAGSEFTGFSTENELEYHLMEHFNIKIDDKKENSIISSLIDSGKTKKDTYFNKYLQHIISWLQFDLYGFKCTNCGHYNNTIMINRIFYYASKVTHCRLCGLTKDIQQEMDENDEKEIYENAKCVNWFCDENARIFEKQKLNTKIVKLSLNRCEYSKLLGENENDILKTLQSLLTETFDELFFYTRRFWNNIDDWKRLRINIALYYYIYICDDKSIQYEEFMQEAAMQQYDREIFMHCYYNSLFPTTIDSEKLVDLVFDNSNKLCIDSDAINVFKRLSATVANFAVSILDAVDEEKKHEQTPGVTALLNRLENFKIDSKVFTTLSKIEFLSIISDKWDCLPEYGCDSNDTTELGKYVYGEHVTFWRSENNTSFIESKNCLLDEVVNQVPHLTKNRYDILCKKARYILRNIEKHFLHKHNIYAQNKPKWNQIIGIDANSKMSEDHIVALLLIIDFPELVQTVKRKIFQCEDKDEAIYIQQKYCNWLRLIREAIVLYGDILKPEEVVCQTLKGKLLFDRFQANFCLPIVATGNKDIGIIGGDEEITIELQKVDSQNAGYLDISLLTSQSTKSNQAFIEQKQYLIFQAKLCIKNIHFVDNDAQFDEREYIQSIRLFDELINGYILTIKPPQKYQNILELYIRSIIDPETVNKNNTIDIPNQYYMKLFQHCFNYYKKDENAHLICINHDAVNMLNNNYLKKYFMKFDFNICKTFEWNVNVSKLTEFSKDNIDKQETPNSPNIKSKIASKISGLSKRFSSKTVNTDNLIKPDFFDISSEKYPLGNTSDDGAYTITLRAYKNTDTKTTIIKILFEIADWPLNKDELILTIDLYCVQIKFRKIINEQTLSPSKKRIIQAICSADAINEYQTIEWKVSAKVKKMNVKPQMIHMTSFSFSDEDEKKSIDTTMKQHFPPWTEHIYNCCKFKYPIPETKYYNEFANMLTTEERKGSLDQYIPEIDKQSALRIRTVLSYFDLTKCLIPHFKKFIQRAGISKYTSSINMFEEEIMKCYETQREIAQNKLNNLLKKSIKKIQVQATITTNYNALSIDEEKDDSKKNNYSLSEAMTYETGIMMPYTSMLPRFQSLADESIFNDVFQITSTKFNNYLSKAKELHRQICLVNCSTETNQQYGIQRFDHIGINHVFIIILYCEAKDYSQAFVKSYLLLNNCDKEIVRRTHVNNFYWFGRYLFESIEYFGKTYSDKDSNNKLYSG